MYVFSCSWIQQKQSSVCLAVKNHPTGRNEKGTVSQCFRCFVSSEQFFFFGSREGKRAVGRGEKEGVAEGEGGGGDGEQTGAKERGEKRVHSTEKPAAESKTRSHERAMVEKEKGKEGGKERRKEGGRERGKEGGKERGKEGGKERGKERKQEGPQQRPHHEVCALTHIYMYMYANAENCHVLT